MGYFCSSVGRKHLMGVTGLAISLFALSHMLGNTLIFLGSDAYNRYGHALTSNKAFLYAAEIGLLVMFVVHVYLGIKLSIENKSARTQKYALPTNGAKKAEFASKTMVYQGLFLLAFIIYHLITFKYGPHYTTQVDGVEMRDLFQLIVEKFKDPAYVFGYVVSMGFVAIHLSHGFSSSFQSLGFNHPRYTPKIRKLSIAYALLIGIGFSAQPLYVYFVY